MSGVEFEIFVFALGGVLVIRAGEDTFVASEDAVVNFIGEVGRNIAFIFDCEIADTSVGVELVVRLQGTCRTGISTFAAT